MNDQLKLLFIDDDLFFAKQLSVEAQKHLVVNFQRKAADAVAELKKNADGYCCAVLDVMMPPPRGWEAKTGQGLYTGLEVLSRCKGEILDANLPIILLSNSEEVISRVKIEILSLPFLDGLVYIQEKRRLNSPVDLFKQVNKMAKKWRKHDLAKK